MNNFYENEQKSSNTQDSEIIKSYCSLAKKFPVLEREAQTALFVELNSLTSPSEEASNISGTDAQKKYLIKKIINHNIGLVISIAKKFPPQMPLEDRIHEGVFGLKSAIEKYDVSKGFAFSTYATAWVYQAISRALINTGRQIRLPNHVADDSQRILKIMGKTGEESDIPEEVVAEKCKLTVERVKQVIFHERNTSTTSLFFTNEFGDEQEHTGIEQIQENLPEDLAIQQELINRVHTALDKLTHTSKDRNTKYILETYFGIGNEECSSLAKIGAQLGVTRERVRQLKNAGMEALTEELQDLR